MTTTLQVRVDEKMKRDAQKVFAKMGLDLSSGIKLYLARVTQDQCVPFPLRVPNAETAKAIRDLEAGKGEVFTGSTDDFFDYLLGKPRKRNA